MGRVVCSEERREGRRLVAESIREMNPKPFRIIPCGEWRAAPPKSAIQIVSAKPVRAIFHHTAGHHAELDGKFATVNYAESIAYAKSIQAFHMKGNGWVDSGHNFLVTRGGYILEGRHRSIAQVQRGQMVVSAHCPGQNEQPGVEHEHIDPEPMTAIQYEAAVWLYAWICRSCKIDPKQIKGHRDYFATACPGSLYSKLPQLRKDVAKALAPPSSGGKAFSIDITDKDGGKSFEDASRASAVKRFAQFIPGGKFKEITFRRGPRPDA